MSIKRITECFVTTDGKIHLSESEAERHESRYRDKAYFDEAYRLWHRECSRSGTTSETLFNALREKGMTFIVKRCQSL